MSTKFTKMAMQLAPPAPLNMLFHLSSRWVTQSVMRLLAEKGYENLSEPQLNLFANLECGSTYASALAANMGISRQAIYRTTRELQDLGYLQLVEDSDRRNQKRIVMTERGMALALDGRVVLEQVEKTLAERIGAANFDQMRQAMEAEWGEVLGE